MPIERSVRSPPTRHAAIAGAGLQVTDVDGFTTGSLLPSSGGQAIVDGVSIVSAAWMAEALGVNPRFCSGFVGYGQIPGSVSLAVSAIASGQAETVVVHRALHNPPKGRYHGNPMTKAPGRAQYMAPIGYWGPLSMIAIPTMEHMQRFGATREDLADIAVECRANGAQIPWSYWYGKPLSKDDYLAARALGPDLHVRLRHPRRWRRGVRLHHRRAGATCRTRRCT